MSGEKTGERPSVGVGLIIENEEGQILILKRINSHAPLYSIPGGGLEFGETFVGAGAREGLEETGLILRGLRQVGITNNLETAEIEGIHSISIILHTNDYDGEPRIVEEGKAAEMFWADPNFLPEPHYEGSRKGVACWLNGEFYISD